MATATAINIKVGKRKLEWLTNRRDDGRRTGLTGSLGGALVSRPAHLPVRAWHLAFSLRSHDALYCTRISCFPMRRSHFPSQVQVCDRREKIEI